ncbi:MAG: hypothetical protein QOD41_4954 [Cryptosporangiaceae bacterium]|jgi:outer membrane protein assembly factor BamB|nr:hypothetical protein [Cryptosporangiaceae bacterium]
MVGPVSRSTTPTFLAIALTIAAATLAFAVVAAAPAAAAGPAVSPGATPAEPPDQPVPATERAAAPGTADPAIAGGALVTGRALPTPPVNGTVWTLAYAGGVVYAGGTFTAARPLGGGAWAARKNLAAFDAATGQLLPWAPVVTGHPVKPPPGKRPDVACNVNWATGVQTCDTVYKLAAANGRLYAGGDFWTVNGQPRVKLAAFSLATGQLDAGFRPPPPGGRVRTLAAVAGVVYAGGDFTAVNGKPRQHLASFAATTGQLYDWAPPLDKAPLSMVFAAGRLVVGGPFSRVAGLFIHGMAAVDAHRSTWSRWDSRPVPLRSHITDLVTDGGSVYAASEGSGTLDGSIAADAATGRLRWVNNCRGATWALALHGGVLYDGSHHHDCSAVGAFPEQHFLRYFRLTAQPTHPPGERPILDYWFPTTNGGDYSLPKDHTPSRLGPRAMVMAGDCLWVGGQFTTVNDVPQQGITHFCPRPSPTSPPTAAAVPTVSAVPAGTWIRWESSEDIDDRVLTYQVVRDGAVVWTGKVAGVPWSHRVLSWTDPGPRGTAYRIRVSDAP